MITIIKTDYYSYAGADDERSKVIAEILVDTSDELPAVDGVDGYLLYQGSSALVITEGKVAVLAGDGKWYIGGEAAE